MTDMRPHRMGHTKADVAERFYNQFSAECIPKVYPDHNGGEE